MWRIRKFDVFFTKLRSHTHRHDDGSDDDDEDGAGAGATRQRRGPGAPGGIVPRGGGAAKVRE